MEITNKKITMRYLPHIQDSKFKILETNHLPLIQLLLSIILTVELMKTILKNFPLFSTVKYL